MNKHKPLFLLPVLLALSLMFTGCVSNPREHDDVYTSEYPAPSSESAQSASSETPSESVSSDTDISTAQNITASSLSFDYNSLPTWDGTHASIEVNNNVPFFTKDEIVSKSYEKYSELDSLGRCGPAVACLGMDTLPTEKRGSIGMVKPSGWHTVKYPDQIKDRYLYNRCHLIAYELSAENANKLNLVTGTRYLNIDGMLPYENKTREYIDQTGNHVMYRSTPVFVGNELVCRGVLMEAYSVEDNGKGLQFCIFCYDVQPEISIDYATGDSHIGNPVSNSTPSADTHTSDITSVETPQGTTYIINTNSKVFHRPDCSAVSKMSQKNKKEYTGNYDDLITEGYKPCSICNPE